MSTGTGTILKGHDLFQALVPKEVERIRGHSSTKKYERDSTVFRHKDKASHVFLLLEGKVHLVLPTGGGEIGLIVTSVEPGEMFGLSPLLGSQRYTATGLCREKCKVLAIEAKPFRKLLEANCGVGLQVMAMVAQAYFSRYIETLERVKGVLKLVPLAR